MAEAAGPPSPLAPDVPAVTPGHGVDVACGHRLAPLGARRRGDLLDPVVPRVDDVEVSGTIDDDTGRTEEERRGSRPTVTRRAVGARRAPGHRVDVACGHGLAPLGARRRGELLDPAVGLVGDVNVSGGVAGDRSRRMERGRGSAPAVARIARCARRAPDHGVDVVRRHGLAPL